MPLDRTKVDRMITMMDAWLTQKEREQAAGICDDDKEEELARGNTMPTPTQPFSDGAPEKIHGQSDQELWPPKPRVPVPIETL